MAIQTNLQQVLNYLRQGHPVLPAQPMQVPQVNPAGNIIPAHMPLSAPKV